MNPIFFNGQALLIGVGGDLPVTVKDATALYDVLVDPKRAAYQPSRVELLTNENANRQKILNAFDNFIQCSEKDHIDTAFIYFSGHGVKVENCDGNVGYYLIPHNYNPALRAGTAISGREFTDKIKAIVANKLIVFLDCCHAGGVPSLKESKEKLTKSPIPHDLINALSVGSGQVIMASSHENEFSYTGPEYSVFTSCLLEALEGNASTNEDGYVRILDILIYLFKNVPIRAFGPQHPFVKKVLDLGDNFPICYRSNHHNLGVKKSQNHSISTTRRRMMQTRLEIIEQDWNLRIEKVKRMRKELAIETSVDIKFKLEQQLLEEESEIAKCASEAEEIEEFLNAV